jgi:hypothetical protein
MQRIIELLKTSFWRVYFLSKSFSAFKGRNIFAKFAILLYFLFALFLTSAIVVGIFEEPLTPEQKVEKERVAEERRILKEQTDLANKQKKEEDRRNAELAAVAAKKKELEQLPLVTANQFAKKYSDNQVAANMEFKGKRFRISGVILKIGDSGGYPQLSLYRNPDTGDDYDLSAPYIIFKKDYYEAISKLEKRQKIVAACTGEEPSGGQYARASDCDLISSP